MKSLKCGQACVLRNFPTSAAPRRAAAAAAVPPITKARRFWAADIVTKIGPPSPSEAAKVGDRTLLSMVRPPQNEALMQQLQDQGSTVFAMDCIPCLLSRGQAFDALSSQANLAGFRAVIEAAHAYGRTMAGSMTAAGKLAPACVLVLREAAFAMPKSIIFTWPS